MAPASEFTADSLKTSASFATENWPTRSAITAGVPCNARGVRIERLGDEHAVAHVEHEPLGVRDRGGVAAEADHGLEVAALHGRSSSGAVRPAHAEVKKPVPAW